MKTLFEVEINQVENKTCKDCEHRQRWECGSKIIQYCGLRKSNLTENKLLKIKCKNKACKGFKENIN
jgi:hypothetical protein